MGYNGNLKDLRGMRFGALVVTRREGVLRRFAAWRCTCDCGAEVVVRSDKLRAGNRKACVVNGHRWHPDRAPGLTRLNKSEYSVWCGMHDRCYNKKDDHYQHYGKRGIKVCERWDSFAAFLEDMGKRPSPKHSIDRFPDTNGNYEPGNCRWATDIEQRRNTRTSVYVEYEGERVLLVELCEKIGLNRGNVYGRLQNGWSLEDAITVPVNRYRKRLA